MRSRHGRSVDARVVSSQGVCWRVVWASLITISVSPLIGMPMFIMIKTDFVRHHPSWSAVILMLWLVLASCAYAWMFSGLTRRLGLA